MLVTQASKSERLCTSISDVTGFTVNSNWVRFHRLVGGLAESSSQVYLQQISLCEALRYEYSHTVMIFLG